MNVCEGPILPLSAPRPFLSVADIRDGKKECLLLARNGRSAPFCIRSFTVTYVFYAYLVVGLCCFLDIREGNAPIPGSSVAML
jgi:hypothetical protein